MQDKIFFSIITPTYNRSERIADVIESIEKQDFVNWELIIVDDGSKDNTKEVVLRYSNKNNRIIYIYQSNQERSVARNTGISAAKGNYICFLDSDDYFQPSHLKELAKHIKLNTDKQFFFTDLTIKTGDNFSIPLMRKYKLGEDFIEYCTTSCIATSRACVKRTLLDFEKFDPSIRISEDTDLWCRIATDDIVSNVPINSYVMVDHDDRSVNENDGFSAVDSLKTLRLIKRKIKGKFKRKAYRKAVAHSLLKIGEKKKIAGFKVQALWMFFRALLTYPSLQPKIIIYQIIFIYRD